MELRPKAQAFQSLSAKIYCTFVLSCHQGLAVVLGSERQLSRLICAPVMEARVEEVQSTMSKHCTLLIAVLLVGSTFAAANNGAALYLALLPLTVRISVIVMAYFMSLPQLKAI